MPFLKIALAAIALSAMATEALAENWLEVSRTAESALISVDKDSGEVSGTHVKFWDRTVYPTARLIGVYQGTPMAAENIKGVVHFVEMRAYHDIDCRQRKYSTAAVNYHDAAGTAVSKVVQYPAPTAIAPNSLPDLEAKLMCPSR